MAKNLVGRNYADMGDKYRNKNTKQEFKAARREQRMAGDAMQEDTLVAEEASSAVQDAAAKAKGGEYQSGQQYYSGGELTDMGAPSQNYPDDDNNPYTVANIEDFDLGSGGAGAKKGTQRLSAQDMKRLKEQGGFSNEEIVDYAENFDFGDGPGASGGKAQNLLNKYKAAITGKEAEDETAVEPVTETETAPTTTPEPQRDTGSTAIGDNSNAAGPQSAETAIGGGTQQTQIAGDNNTVTNNQAIDNSRTYGGSSRIFNYQGSGNPATDTPVSAATMAGFYDVDDSPAANAGRLDRQIDQNRQNQQFYKESTSGIAQKAIDNASKNAYIDPQALKRSTNARTQNSFDRANVMGANIFGDTFAMTPPKWNSPKDPDKVEQPDFGDMYDKYTNF